MLRRECAKVGFDPQVKKVPNDGYWGAIRNRDPRHVADWNMRPTPGIMMSPGCAPGAKWNESAWDNERMGALLRNARAKTDPAKRYEIHCEMQRLVATEAGAVIALNLACLVSGGVIVETVFACPGLAKRMVDGVQTRDLPLVQACAMIFCGLRILLIPAADLAAIMSNPRLRRPQ